MKLPSLFSSALVGLLFAMLVPAWSQPSSGRFYALRLHPGQDLKIALTNFIIEHNLKACALISCVGSLSASHLRFANESNSTLVEGPLEIISLSGSGGNGAWHLHLAVADQRGRVTAGHLVEGSIVRTTAELTLIEMEDYSFEREDDPNTGFKELIIRQRPSK